MNTPLGLITRSVLLLPLAGMLAGCANQKQAETIDRSVRSYFDGNYAGAAQELDALSKKTNEDFVLNNLRLGSSLLAEYDLDDAEAAFLRAIEVINSTGVNDGGRTLGAVLVDEKVKVWKGEPFERAMASFYLGLIYYMRQDYQNARASFENALFKLRDYNPDTPDQSKDVDSNFAPAMIMLAKSFQRVGRDDLAEANFRAVREKFPQLADLADPAANRESNLLLVIDYGHGPRKVTDFDGSIVGFSPRPDEEGPPPRPTVLVDGTPVRLQNFATPPVDLLALAQDRKWQSIDTIRAVKSAVGTGLLTGGAIEGVRGINGSGARQRTDLMVAGALVGTGLLLKATSHADVRQWEMLPRTTYVLPIKLPPGQHDVTVEFSDGQRQTWRKLIVPEKQDATYYFRMLRWNSGPFDWPPAAFAKAEQ